jgi:hypothetical protein
MINDARDTREGKMIISSQRHLDGEIVAAKRAAHDYAVTLSPEFEVGDVQYQAILDGHHSLAAAKLDGVDPVYRVATVQVSDNVALLDASIEDFLTASWIDSDWYDVETGLNVW